MASGTVGNSHPFDGPLWDAAAPMIRNRPKGLTNDQLLKLVDQATADLTVTPQEEALLKAVANPENVKKIAAAMKGKTDRAPFAVNGLDLSKPRSQAISLNLRTGLAGTLIGASYDPKAADRQSLIQAAAKQAKVGPGQSMTMATPTGRDAILDRYGQMMGAPVYGDQACGAACLVALAVNAGPAALGALAAIVRNDAAYDPAFAQLCDRLGKPDAAFTLADLARLQDMLLERMQLEETNRQVASGKPLDGESNAGLSPETLNGFIDAHAKALGPLFAGGADILAVDNTGDGALDHFVAYVPRGGKDRIFDPFELKAGHHLITDPLQMRPYGVAAARFK
jgi:hypothetical protein